MNTALELEKIAIDWQLEKEKKEARNKLSRNNKFKLNYYAMKRKITSILRRN